MRIRDKESLSAWDGDWEERIYKRIKELRYLNYRDYLRARAGRSYRDLAKELSRDEGIAPYSSRPLQHLHAQSVTPAERQDATVWCSARARRNLQNGMQLAIEQHS